MNSNDWYEYIDNARVWLARDYPDRYSDDMTRAEVQILLFELHTEAMASISDAMSELDAATIAAAKALQSFGQAAQG